MAGRSAITIPCREAGSGARIRRRRQANRRLRHQDGSGRGISSPLGTKRHGHYDKKQFPDRYRDGVFIAFHGSWDRAPYPQGGYNVVFQPLVRRSASAAVRDFCGWFCGSGQISGGAAHRPSGVAVGPDGALYVSDDVAGRIYKIVYRRGAGAGGNITACPSAASPAGEVVAVPANPPEGTNPDAGKAAKTN